MSTLTRRYDIDWLRVIAIGLLLIYHVAIGFQPWGIMIGFISNDNSWTSLWLPMGILNVWRIPFLFFVSGMGVFFAMQHRTWKQLLLERTLRIFVPYVFGILCIFPLSVLIWQHYYKWDLTYNPNPGHLWFLGNIFAYVVLLLPLFNFLKNNEHGAIARRIRKTFSHPVGLVLIVACCIGEALILQPNPYELYAMTWHGFALGFLAFFFGFCIMFSGQEFWSMIIRLRWIFLLSAIVFFTVRLMVFEMRMPLYLLVIESDCWIFSVLAFGHKHLNRDSNVLRYLSEAAYPVYITHMIFLFLGSLLIFPLDLPVEAEFLMVFLFTITGCFIFYELVIRRLNLIRPLFGLKIHRNRKTEIKPIVSEG